MGSISTISAHALVPCLSCMQRVLEARRTHAECKSKALEAHLFQHGVELRSVRRMVPQVVDLVRNATRTTACCEAHHSIQYLGLHFFSSTQAPQHAGGSRKAASGVSGEDACIDHMRRPCAYKRLVRNLCGILFRP